MVSNPVQGIPPCDYLGTNANAAYQLLVQCDDPAQGAPLEVSTGSTGADCVHWAENCLRSELMTPQLFDGVNRISTVTIGSLEDLGYTVDYGAADTFDFNDFSLADCPCATIGSRRSLLRGNVTAVRQIPVSNMTSPTSKLSSSSPPPRMSDAGRAAAIAYGKKELARATREERPLFEAASLVAAENGEAFEDEYVGDRMITVLHFDSGEWFEVVVFADW